MINLDERYHSYLHTDKCFNIDGSCEKVRAYGWNSEGDAIVDIMSLQVTSNYSMIWMECLSEKKTWLNNQKLRTYD